MSTGVLSVILAVTLSQLQRCDKTWRKVDRIEGIHNYASAACCGVLRPHRMHGVRTIASDDFGVCLSRGGKCKNG